MQSRVIFKVFATGLNFLISLILGIVVPRAIGVSSYGDFSYITSTYSFIFQFFLLSSTTAYIYFLSQEKYKKEEISSFYFLFLIGVFFIGTILGFASILNIAGMEFVWHSIESKNLLYLGLVFALLSILQQVLVDYSDASMQTLPSEKIKLLSRLLIGLSVVALFFTESLDIYSYFLLSILNLILFFLLFLKYITFNFARLSKERFLKILNDFYSYLQPLILFTLVSSLYSYIGKYVLQYSSGSLEQGYYNFSLQLALIPVLFLSSLMAIYMSEMTKKFQNNDKLGVKDIFSNNIFKIYAIHAFISFFILINAKEIIVLSVGESFLGATSSLQILSIFSLLHTFGMLSGNLFFSSSRTKEYNIINSVVMLFGIAYIASLLIFETKLNATHLAFVMSGFYFVRVAIQLYVNLEYLEMSKTKFIQEFLLSTVIILIVLEEVNSLSYNLFVNLIFSLMTLLVINFIFKDYLKLTKIIKV